MARQIQGAIGANARERRRELGLTQEDIAQRLRSAGLRWSRPAVAALEAGNRDVSIGEFLLLAAALEAGAGRLLRIPSDEQVLIDRCWLSAAQLERLVEGAERHAHLIDEIQGANHLSDDAPFEDHAADRKRASRTSGASEKEQQERALAARYDVDALDGALLARRSTGEAERRAAARIGDALERQISGFEVSLAAISLWGHGLAAERDKRAAERPRGATAATRGHVSRALEEELRRRILEAGEATR